MTRRFCAFAAALITIVTSLVAFTWAQAPAGGFEQFWGARYTYPSSGVTATPSSGLTATTARRPNPPPDPGTSNAMHHWNHVAMARAESTSASTGPLTRPRASRRGGALRTTSSRTPSGGGKWEVQGVQGSGFRVHGSGFRVQVQVRGRCSRGVRQALARVWGIVGGFLLMIC